MEPPRTLAMQSPVALSGRYANRGLCYSSAENHPLEDYLEVTVGMTPYSSRPGDILVIRATEESLSFSSFDAGHVVREKTLKRNVDYRVVDGGVEFTWVSEGSGGEGNLSTKVTTRLLLGLEQDGTLLIKAHEDIRGLGGILFPWPYHDTCDLWSEFKKEANQ